MFTGHSFYLLAAQKAKNAPFESFCSFWALLWLSSLRPLCPRWLTYSIVGHSPTYIYMLYAIRSTLHALRYLMGATDTPPYKRYIDGRKKGNNQKRSGKNVTPAQAGGHGSERPLSHRNTGFLLSQEWQKPFSTKGNNQKQRRKTLSKILIIGPAFGSFFPAYGGFDPVDPVIPFAPLRAGPV